MIMQSERLDLRMVPVWERPGKVFDLFDSLPAGVGLTLVTNNEPRGLASRLEQGRRHQLVIDPQRVSHNEWLIHITRSTPEPDASGALSVLKRTPVFASVRPDVTEMLAAESTMQVARRGNIIVADNAEWSYIGVVLEGVLASSSGSHYQRQRIFSEIFPFEIFGALELFDDAPASSRISVLSKNARYVRIPREAFIRGGAVDPNLYLACGRVVAQRSRDLMQMLAAQSTMPIIARIAQVLLPFAPPEQGMAPALAPLPTMTQAQIAAAAGTVKEVAARAIAELEQQEALRRERGHIKYLNRSTLIELSRKSA
jgi:CRP-like cAMP-binding protein